ncbi:MAG: GTP 3',8-cyclase MoaA [Dehalococcoidales bacterium]|nr:GTP 3',8-cyclase MoaA [Dehalococcoidales bacterium]
MTSLVDSFGRSIDYMRISVTDRCDLRCIYCASSDFKAITHEEVLRYEEINRVVEAAATLGVTKIRLTGGEPLTRLNLAELVRMLSSIDGIEEVSMTTNATRLARYASELKQSGLKRVNISLDSLQPAKFTQITGGDKLADVLAGIEAANKTGLTPVKINMVVLKGINDNEIPDFVRKTIIDGWHVRFIEHMPFQNSDSRGKGLVSSEAIMTLIRHQFGELIPHHPEVGNGPASYYRLAGAKGTLGFIGAVTDCFCEGCNRFRLTADGKLRPCLLDNDEIDIKAALRRGASIDELAEIIQSAAMTKREKHHLSDGNVPAGRSMRQIGG